MRLLRHVPIWLIILVAGAAIAAGGDRPVTPTNQIASGNPAAECCGLPPPLCPGSPGCPGQ